MVNARRSEAWDHTASLLATLYNINRSKSAQAKTLDDFHPIKSQEKADAKAENRPGNRQSSQDDIDAFLARQRKNKKPKATE